MIRGVPRRHSDDRGLALIFVALLMVVVLVVAALVTDLGAARHTKREEQRSTDLAALAAGRYLAGAGSSSAIRDPQAACAAAIHSVQTDLEGFRPALSGVERTSACSLFPVNAAICTNASSSQTVTVSRGAYTLTITYPVSAARIADSRRTGGSGPDDGVQCERMAVDLRHVADTYFAQIVGIDEYDIHAGAVVRGTGSTSVKKVAALMILERVDCAAMQVSGQGGVVVQASSASNAGIIQIDSAGQVPPNGNCTTNNNAGGHVLYGTALPPAAGGGPSIIAQDASDGTAGIIGLYSLSTTVNGRGAYTTSGGITPAPVSTDKPSSRQLADDQYNSSSRHSITDLHATGSAAVTSPAPGGATTITTCSGLSGSQATAATVYVDCAGEFSAGNDLTFPNASTVIFRGKVSVPNNSELYFPVARRIYVRGCTGTCSGSNDYAISVAGTFRINSTGASCTSQASSTNTAALATFSGPVLVTGTLSWCQTMVYLADTTATPYARTTSTTGPAIAQCSASLPCPITTSTNNAYIAITGGGGTADWSAPNQLSAAPVDSDYATHPFEDLALWAESPSASEIKGQGSNRTEGVFFLPNAAVRFTGQASQVQPLNAQFWARTLDLSGQGDLNLRPNPNDAISVAIPGSYLLIR